MSRTLLFASALVLVALVADQARADSVYAFSSSGSQTTISGTLTTSDTANGDGSYTIESITGTYSGPDASGAITGLVPSGGFFNDNELFVTSPGVPGPGPYLDINGFSFNVGHGGAQENIFFGGSYRDISSINMGSSHVSFTLTSSAVPEPSSLILGGIAAIGGLIAVVLRRRAAVAA